MKAIRYLLMAMLATLAGCGDGGRFVIDLECGELGEQSVTMTYYADGSVHQTEGRARGEGKITLEGAAQEPTLVDLTLTATGQPLTTLVARNGDHLRVTISLDDPEAMTVKGSATAQAMAQFMAEHGRDDDETLNAAIAAYVADHRGEVAATALLVSQFRIEGEEALADSLLNIIDPQARPLNMIESFNAVLQHRLDSQQRNLVRTMTLTGVRDSAVTYTPQKHSLSLLAFSGRDNSRRQEMTQTLRQLRRDYGDSRLGVVEVSLLPDSAAWRTIVRPDSLRWTQTWVRGAAASQTVSRLGVTRTPYYIVVDSVGHQLLRTPSPSEAAAFIRQRLR